MDDLLNIDTLEKRLEGISGSPGICIGKAYIVDREGVDVVKKYFIASANLPKEIDRFIAAVQKAKNELQEIIESLPADLGSHAYILETHMLLHKDKMIYGKTIEIIKSEKVNAEWALKTAVSDIQAIFKDITDPYLKERIADISHVSERIMRNLVGAQTESIASINKRVILVAQDLSPADTSQIQLERIMGFVTDRGGKTSHTSIIARTLEIPAVLGLGNATNIIKNDEIIIVDGSSGAIIVNPSEETLLQYEEKKLRYEEYQATMARVSHLPAETIDGYRLKLMGNIEMPEEIVSVLDNGGEGVGLYRTEFLYLGATTFPKEDELFEQYKEVVELMSPNPVIIRTLDINGDKVLNYMPTPEEPNPALGLRAIRFCLNRPDVFRTQLRAIFRATIYGNIKLMLPMISCCEEVIAAKRIIQEVTNCLEDEGVEFNKDIPLGIMIEIPSAVIIADELADLVDFFSIGTNDLTQYSLAIDRGNRQVAYLYHSLHPSIIRMVKHVIDVGKKKKIEISMCGEMASDPVNVPILLGLGMRELSMTPQSIPAIKNSIRQLSSKNLEPFIEKILKQSTAEGVINLLKETYGEDYLKQGFEPGSSFTSTV